MCVLDGRLHIIGTIHGTRRAKSGGRQEKIGNSGAYVAFRSPALDALISM